MKQLGLIGYPLGHSFSENFFSEKFKREGIIDHAYALYPIVQIEQLTALLDNSPDLVGLNVTIPYKEKVVAYLNHMSPVVKVIGACNCIKIVNGVLTGYNTDVIGFSKSLRPKLEHHHQRALVFGTGGSAKAVHFVLKELDIPFLKVSRTPAEDMIPYEAIDASILQEYRLLVNTTPLGMHPNIETAPEIPYEFIGPQHYLFDLVYNPHRTRFLQEGISRGAVVENGSDMLKIQAEASWDIWSN